MSSLRDIYTLETLARLERAHHRRARAPGDEGPRRGLVRAAARRAGRALVGLGARLLAFGGEGARVYLAPHHTPRVPHQN
ncbi:MAG TPA: hypothetical protein PKD53_14365 [Chloroflexaceae bacterium]|nr:hypothetical protein [Chloroflexaceae bacterium]